MDESTSLAPQPESTPAQIPPGEPRWQLDSSNAVIERPVAVETPEAARWGLDGSGDVVELARESPAKTALTTDDLGASLDKPVVALDANNNITSEFVESLAAPMKAQRTRATKAPKAEAVAKGFEEFELSTDQIKSTLGAVRAMYTEPNGVFHTLKTIHEDDPATYTKIAATVVGSHPHFAIAQLKAMGILPADFGEPIERVLPADLVGYIDEDLRDTARTVPSTTLYDWADVGALNHNLAQEKQRIEMWNAMMAKGAAQWETALAQAKAEGNAQLEELSNQHYDEYAQELTKWKPFGDDEQTNAWLRHKALNGAYAELLADSKWLATWRAINIRLIDAPQWRLHGRALQADIDEQDARKDARRFSARLGQFIRDGLRKFDSLFNAKQVKKEPEPPPDPEPLKLDSQNNITDEWTHWTIRESRRRQQAVAAK